MNDRERITQLEAMLTEERDEVSCLLTIIENYARGLDMMARVMYGETPAGSMDEENARAVKQYSGDMQAVLGARAANLRGLMGRAMPADQPDMTESEVKAMFKGMFPFGLVANGSSEVPEVPSLVEAAERPEGATIH